MLIHLTHNLASHDIRDQLTHLAAMSAEAIGEGVRALMTHDMVLARAVSVHDVYLNQARYDIEERSCALLSMSEASQAPTHAHVNRDPRALIGAVNVATNLERIGDLAAGIAHLSLHIDAALTVPAMLEQMGLVAQEMVGTAIDAFLTNNDLLAEYVARRDRELEEMHEQVYGELAVRIASDAPLRDSILRLLWAGYKLVQIGSCTTNICERTIYVSTGELKEFR